MNMIDGWPAPWWCVTLVVFLAVSGFAAWCWAAARALEWLWQSRYARLADPEPYPDEPMAYPVDPPPGYHFEVHDENWLEELPAERTGEQLGFHELGPGHHMGWEDRREPLDLADDTRTWAWGPGGPASLPVLPPAISAAIDQLHEAEERHYLAAPALHPAVAADLGHSTVVAAVDSIYTRVMARDVNRLLGQ